jgi:hypothetical protein
MSDIPFGAGPAVRPRPAGSRLRSTGGLDLDRGARRGCMMAGRRQQKSDLADAPGGNESPTDRVVGQVKANWHLCTANVFADIA